MTEKVTRQEMDVDTRVGMTDEFEMFELPALHIGKLATGDTIVVPGATSSEVIIPGTPVKGTQERGIVVLDEYKGGSLDTVPGTDQYIEKQEEIANIARSENALNSSNKMQY